MFNGGAIRNPQDRFYALVVPRNDNPFFFFPVIGFPLERPDLDLGVVEIGACENGTERLPALPVTFASQQDGSKVVTVGFPAPEIVSINADPQGRFRGGQFFLKSHANEGIVSAQYNLGAITAYELNVGWHHGESGGPVVSITNDPAVFTVMQHYRNVQGPHGIMAGPHRGVSLLSIEQELRNLGVGAV